MPPQEGRAGGLPVRPCPCTDYRKKQRQTEEDNGGWLYWHGKRWSPPEVQAHNDAYWRGHVAGCHTAAAQSSWQAAASAQ
eukprot:11801761-Alexandrium_andersonii.AAC.1